ncbi:hypothetical protein HYFRA_00004671 [Hymenoscyphus fraxineus]|uniref:Uncharacterized protein n=1 Tax=Hymenoscyphus fraxineus TaxID=746836 RepID=A0A9N9KVV4_9HELO|nr:hypothetical protein HYFRA_00004671 [Hymenoscyphus fraxineus]
MILSDQYQIDGNKDPSGRCNDCKIANPLALMSKSHLFTFRFRESALGYKINPIQGPVKKVIIT